MRLRCRFCQQAWLLDPSRIDSEELDPSLWASLQLKGARSLSFVGGNPDESVYSILRFLVGAPQGWKLPIVWNCHGYAPAETISLLEGVVDIYLPDFKYGNDGCANELSLAPDYFAVAKESSLGHGCGKYSGNCSYSRPARAFRLLPSAGTCILNPL